MTADDEPADPRLRGRGQAVSDGAKRSASNAANGDVKKIKANAETQDEEKPREHSPTVSDPVGTNDHVWLALSDDQKHIYQLRKHIEELLTDAAVLTKKLTERARDDLVKDARLTRWAKLVKEASQRHAYAMDSLERRTSEVEEWKFENATLLAEIKGLREENAELVSSQHERDTRIMLLETEKQINELTMRNMTVEQEDLSKKYATLAATCDRLQSRSMELEREKESLTNTKAGRPVQDYRPDRDSGRRNSPRNSYRPCGDRYSGRDERGGDHTRSRKVSKPNRGKSHDRRASN